MKNRSSGDSASRIFSGLRKPAFVLLVAVQLAVAIGALYASSVLHESYLAALAQQSHLEMYRRQMDGVFRLLARLTSSELDVTPKDRASLMSDAAAKAVDVANALPAGASPQAAEQARNIRVCAAMLIASARSLNSEVSNKAAMQAEARLRIALRQMRFETYALDTAGFRELNRAERLSGWITALESAAMLLLLAALLYVVSLRRKLEAEVSDRVNIECELRNERNSLEHRVEQRTGELLAEIEERRRAEKLNRDKNVVLEMLAHNKAMPELFRALAEVVANQRSTWCCAVHLLEGDGLVLAGESRLPHTLKCRVTEIPASLTDAPEAVAIRTRGLTVSDSAGTNNKPWSELLRAHGVQSVFSAPFSGIDEALAGTVTLYALMHRIPDDSEVEMIRMACQLAALILDRHRMNQQLIHYAYHDSLTGLLNRRMARDRLRSALRRADTNAGDVSVLWIDLDKFKQINDLHGHSVGDLVLQEVARRLTSGVRAGDTVARMGGDEFLIVLECVKDRATAEAIAADLLTTLAKPIRVNGLQLEVSASIGIARYPEDGSTADLLEKQADTAMYEAKFSKTSY